MASKRTLPKLPKSVARGVLVSVGHEDGKADIQSVGLDPVQLEMLLWDALNAAREQQRAYVGYLVNAAYERGGLDGAEMALPATNDRVMPVMD